MPEESTNANSEFRQQSDDTTLPMNDAGIVAAGEAHSEACVDNPKPTNGSPHDSDTQQVLADAAKLAQRLQSEDDTTIPTKDSPLLRNTQRVLDEADDTLDRREQIKGTIDTDDTTLMRNPQRMVDLADSLFKDNARLRNEQKRDHLIHTIVWGSMLTVIVIQSGIIIKLVLLD